MATGKIKSWAEFQHYKDRSPPWIKLHRGFLDNYEFACLPIASKALAPMIWLLAAESNDGTVRIDTEWLAFRLRWPEVDVLAGLKPLCDGGFVIVDSETLAGCLRGACLEGEGETEREGEKKPSPPKAKKPKAPEPTIDAWLADLDGADAVPAADPLFAWAAKQAIPADWLGYAWAAFEDRYAGKEKVYADWRAAFRDHVKRGWLDIWRADTRNGGFVLTTVGEQWRNEVAA